MESPPVLAVSRLGELEELTVTQGQYLMLVCHFSLVGLWLRGS